MALCSSGRQVYGTLLPFLNLITKSQDASEYSLLSLPVYFTQVRHMIVLVVACFSVRLPRNKINAQPRKDCLSLAPRSEAMINNEASDHHGLKSRELWLVCERIISV